MVFENNEPKHQTVVISIFSDNGVFAHLMVLVKSNANMTSQIWPVTQRIDGPESNRSTMTWHLKILQVKHTAYKRDAHNTITLHLMCESRLSVGHIQYDCMTPTTITTYVPNLKYNAKQYSRGIDYSDTIWCVMIHFRYACTERNPADTQSFAHTSSFVNAWSWYTCHEASVVWKLTQSDDLDNRNVE